MKQPIANPRRPYLSLIILTGSLIAFMLMSCRLISQVYEGEAEISPSATSSTIDTPPPSPTPQPSNTPFPSATPLPSATPTHTLIPPTLTYTLSPTPTLPPPTFTPGANELVAGYDVWILDQARITPRLTVWESTFSPRSYLPDKTGGYQFLRLDFECATDAPLISLLTGEDQGVTFMHRRVGFANVYFQGSRGKQYPVQFIGACWLAAIVDPREVSFTLYFLNLVPLPVSP